MENTAAVQNTLAVEDAVAAQNTVAVGSPVAVGNIAAVGDTAAVGDIAVVQIRRPYLCAGFIGAALVWVLAACASSSGGPALSGGGGAVASSMAASSATASGRATTSAGAAKVYQGAVVACSTGSRPKNIPAVTLKALPAQAVTTLRLIAAGGPFPYTQDDTVFGNYAKTLPRERYGYYREFTVPTPGSGSRGARRIVAGSAGDDYYTPDHYASFDWISCAG